MKAYLEKLTCHQHLTSDEMKEAITYCLTEQATDAEIAALLTALKTKGETAEEIAGIVDAIRCQSTFQTSPIPNALDNCGTGGDRSQSFNISTTSAFVIAGAGIPVAKHGNRSITSKAGSADVLEALGISLYFSKEQVEELLYENNIAFLFAPHVHEALKSFSRVRKFLGIPTVFNVIGPLTNPIPLDYQLLGVYRKDLMPILADTLQKLGRKRAVVVHGAGSMDEATLSGENHLLFIDNGQQTSITIRPEDVGLPYYSKEEIVGGSSRENADILVQVLKGKKGAYYNTVLLNAGLGIFTSGKASTLLEGIELARESIESGKAYERLHYLIKYSQKQRKEVI
jgi:anthranilate phosphoribosyltransferase